VLVAVAVVVVAAASFSFAAPVAVDAAFFASWATLPDPHAASSESKATTANEATPLRITDAPIA
jgi:hypothetical protein